MNAATLKNNHVEHINALWCIIISLLGLPATVLEAFYQSRRDDARRTGDQADAEDGYAPGQHSQHTISIYDFLNLGVLPFMFSPLLYHISTRESRQSLEKNRGLHSIALRFPAGRPKPILLTVSANAIAGLPPP